MSVPIHFRTAFRTVFWRKVKAGTNAAVCDKLAMFTLGADVVWCQRVDFGNSCHRCHKRGANRTTGTNLIPMVYAIPNQFLCNDIQHRKTMFDDRGEFAVQSLFYQFRQWVTIDFLCLSIGDSHQIFLGTVNGRRKGTVRERLNVFNLICNGIGVGNNNFVCLFFTKIGEFFQHFFRGTQIQRRLKFCIVIALSGLQDLAVNGIFLVHEVHVTGCTNRNSQFITQCNNFAVVFLQLFHIGSSTVSNHESIIPCRLDFQIVIELCQFHNFLMRFLFHECSEEFAGFAGTAENQALPILHQH